MENKGDWEGNKSNNNNNNNNLVNELTRGKELARQLQMHMSNGTTSSQETCEYLVQKILVSFEKGISLLNWGNNNPNPIVVPAPVTSGAVDPLHPIQHGASGSGVQESPTSLGGSDQDSDRDQDNRDRKRKNMPRWTKQVRVNPGMGLEGPLDDGYSWRKYGQKEILGARFPRGYYRCTHRNVQGCLATKQVQRSDEDPNIFEITYRGRHTCLPSQSNTSSPTIDNQPIISSQQYDQTMNMINVQLEQQLGHENMLSSLRSGLRVITDGLNDNDFNVKPEIINDSRFLTPNTFVSPATSATNYLSPQPGVEDHFGVTRGFQNPNSEPEINTTNDNNNNNNNNRNVGTGNLEFQFGHVDDQFDPNFFGHPGFY